MIQTDFRASLMVDRRDVGHRGQGDVRHGNISSDMHKNQNEHMHGSCGKARRRPAIPQRRLVGTSLVAIASPQLCHAIDGLRFSV